MREFPSTLRGWFNFIPNMKPIPNLVMKLTRFTRYLITLIKGQMIQAGVNIYLMRVIQDRSFKHFRKKARSQASFPY
ncbi:12520_t:CDS:2, partial [Funneliformis mosseae]